MRVIYYSFIFCIFLLIQCTNAPSDLSQYKKFHYFDVITMQGVGKPNDQGIKDNEFVYVKNGDSNIISVYYPIKDVLIYYTLEDSMWTLEFIKEYKETGEKYKINFFSIDDSLNIEYVQDLDLSQNNKCNMWFSQKDFSICIKVDCGIVWTKEKLREIIREQVNIGKFKNMDHNEVLIRKFNIGNYTLYYFLEKYKKNAYLSYAINKSKTPLIHDADDTETEKFLSKYPEYKYKTNLREF